MRAMNIQERYDELAELSGCSEQVVRRVLKAVQQSLIKSLKQGRNATLPGVCTLYPELRNRLDYEEGKMTKYVKIKAKASAALETEFSKVKDFETEEEKDLHSILNIKAPELHRTSEDRYGSKDGVRTSQINALL